MAQSNEPSVSDRGFRYWDPVQVDHGAIVSVYESSAAREVPCLWLSIEGEAHLTEPPRPIVGVAYGVASATLAAHLTLDDAKAVHASLGAAIAAQEGT